MPLGLQLALEFVLLASTADNDSVARPVDRLMFDGIVGPVIVREVLCLVHGFGRGCDEYFQWCYVSNGILPLPHGKHKYRCIRLLPPESLPRVFQHSFPAADERGALLKSVSAVYVQM